MTDTIPITYPAGFAVGEASAFARADGSAVTVSREHPLPVTIVGKSATTPLAGDAATNQIAGPFIPDGGAPIWLDLSGNWHGEIVLLRSAGIAGPKRPLTLGGEPYGRFSAPLCEAVAADSSVDAHYWLEIRITSGSVAYRVSQ